MPGAFVLRYLLLPVLLSLPAGHAIAQGGPPPRLLLQALDTNGDGTLSADEIQHATDTLLKLDRNHDGQLTPDEYLSQRTDAQPADDTVQRLMAFDRNGDGVLTADELPDRMQPLFQRGDANHDGKLTNDEIRAMAHSQSGLQGRAGGPNSAEGIQRQDPLINCIDIDHDGVLTAAELASASGALKTLDTNADGSLQPAEIRILQATPGERAAHLLEEWDFNKDGVLSKEEAPDRMQQQFTAIDTNHDGKLDREELTTYFATQPQQRRGDAAPRNDAPSAPRLPAPADRNALPIQPNT